MKIVVFLAPSEEGGFTAYVPSLPGCISEGGTIDEAMANIREAFELYVEPTEDDLIPEEDNALTRHLELDWRSDRSTEESTPSAPVADSQSTPSNRTRTRSLVIDPNDD
jgi:predicted RNase H-like HicB family nuclease